MAYVTDSSVWEVGVYKIETGDKVLGGTETSIANLPHLHLNRRINYIYDALFNAGSVLSTPVDIRVMNSASGILWYSDVSQNNTGFGRAPAANYAVDISEIVATPHNILLSVLNGTATTGSNITYVDKTDGVAFQVGVDTNGDFGIYNYGTADTPFLIDGTTGAVTFNDAGNATSDFLVKGDTDAALFHVDAGNDNIGVGTATPLATSKLYVTSTLTNAITGTTSGTTGISGISTSASASAKGISGVANNGATGAAGVRGSSTGATGWGVHGMVTHATGACVGVKGEVTTSTSATSKAIWGVMGGSGYAGYFEGDVLITGDAWIQTSTVVTSDRNLKTAIKPIHVLESLRKNDDFSIYEFEYKNSKSSNVYVSPMAQDIDKVFGYTYYGKDGEMGLPPALPGSIALQGVIELVKELDDLKEKIRLLEGRV